MKKKKVFLSIGNFDGVHLGHQKIIKALLKKAEGKDVQKSVLTFDPHPVKILSPFKVPHLLTSLEHKKKMLFEMGIDILYVAEFNKILSNMSTEDFIKKVLKQRLKVSEVFVGENFAIGPKKAGAIEKIKHLFKEHGIKVNVISVKKVNGVQLSSTVIRKEILAGKIEKVKDLLGKEYCILGTVVKGKGVGRALGFPTANIDPHNEIIPKQGVYPVKVLFSGKRYKGIVNIGNRPTVKGTDRTIEVHIMDFNKDIYGKDIEIFFVTRFRSEKKFKNVELLKEQIRKDIERARSVLS